MDNRIVELNVQSLGNCYPGLAERLNLFLQTRRIENRPPEYDFPSSSSGNILCRSHSTGEWIHGPENPQQQAEDWIRGWERKKPGLIVVWRSGLGYAARILEQRPDPLRIILCESRLELVWECLCRWDCRGLIENKRFYWQVADDLETSLKKLASDYPSLFRPGVAMVPGSVFPNDEITALQHLSAELSASSRTIEPFSRRENELAIISYAIPEVMPAVMQGVKQCGLTPVWKDRPHTLARFLDGLNTWRETLGGVPRVALGFYGTFFSPDELRDMGKVGVSRAVWYYDHPENAFTGEENSCFDLALTFDSHHLNVMRPVFGEKARRLSAATAFEDFQPTGKLPCPLRPVTYVGATGYRLALPFLQQNPSLSALLVRKVASAVRDSLGGDPVWLLDRLQEEGKTLPVHFDANLLWLLRQLAVIEIRKAFLQAALPYGLTIFGDAYWRNGQLVGSLTQAFSGTSLRYDLETPEVYAASTINLSICHPQVINGNPFRIYDVLACGGFLLAEYRPILEEEFTIGRDLDVFRTPEELSQKIDFYLKNETLRREIAAQGRETVLARHTYRNRIAALLSMLENLR